MKESIEINLKSPRQAVFRSFKGHSGPCPACGSDLHNCKQTYLVATLQGKQATDSFILHGDFGWFCLSCPVVVINVEKVGEMLSFTIPGWKVGSEFQVPGIVDMGAVPASKRYLTIGSPGNPVSLVKFRNQATPESGGSTKTKNRLRWRKQSSRG